MARRNPTMLPLTPRNIAGALVLLGLGLAGGFFAGQQQSGGDSAADAADIGGEAVLAAFAARRSDQWLEAGGVVTRTLADDNQGDRHQRFIVEVAPGHTLLVAHNIDLAPRVPLTTGDRVVMRGEYEWTQKGGVLHWTHHDPGGRRDGGWIRHSGKTYR